MFFAALMPINIQLEDIQLLPAFGNSVAYKFELWNDEEILISCICLIVCICKWWLHMHIRILL